MEVLREQLIKERGENPCGEAPRRLQANLPTRYFHGEVEFSLTKVTSRGVSIITWN